MGHDNAGNNLMRSPQILHEVEYELRLGGHHDDARTKRTGSHMIGNSMRESAARTGQGDPQDGSGP